MFGFKKRTSSKFVLLKAEIQKRLNVYDTLMTGSNPSIAVKTLQNEFSNLMKKAESIDKYGVPEHEGE